MDLDEFMWRERLTHYSFGRKLGVNPATIARLRKRICSPSLATALKIRDYSNGKVELTELLNEKDCNELDIPFVKSHQIVK